MRYFYDALLLDGPRSGVEVSVAELATALSHQLGGELCIVCRRGVADAEAWAAEARVEYAPAWARGRIGRIIAEQLWLPRLGDPTKLLHGPAYVLALRWPGPSVLTIYDLIALRHPEWTKLSNAMHYRLVLPASARKADVIIAPSHVVADEICEELNVRAEKIRVVPLGVRETFRRPASREQIEAFKRRHGLERPFFAVVGNIEPKKNIRGIVKAFEIAAPKIPHELVIAGRKAWRSGPDMMAISRSPFADRIRLLGRLSDLELQALYSCCTAVVQWSLYEGFGLVPLEAMSCGAAVVISDGGALPETAGPAALLVPLGRFDELAEALIQLATDEAFRQSVAARGKEWAKSFTWSAHAVAVAEIYRALV